MSDAETEAHLILDRTLTKTTVLARRSVVIDGKVRVTEEENGRTSAVDFFALPEGDHIVLGWSTAGERPLGLASYLARAHLQPEEAVALAEILGTAGRAAIAARQG